MKYSLASSIILSFLTSLVSIAQTEYAFLRNDSPQVIVDGEVLDSPWAGGINAAQFSRIDLDFDGDKDIFIFDRSGDRIITFLNEDNQSGSIAYKHSYDFNDNFPELSEWCLLRDLNCDGKSDLITKAPNSMKVYFNTGNAIDGLQFELFTDLLYAEYNYSGVPFDAPVYTVTIDIPAIDDIDGDGDLDIITFSEIASTLYYYENFAIDEGEGNNDCSTPVYKLSNRCYGSVNEASEDNTLFIGEDHICDFNVLNPRSGIHTGGTLLTLDTNEDGFKEVVIADVSFNNLKMLINGPSEQGPDSVIAVIPDFPASLQSTQAVEMKVFPSAFYEDIDNDGVNDLIVSTNNPDQSEDDESMWLYLNNGSSDAPDFSFIQSDFLQDEMIEVGRGSYPVLEDYNMDGLPDLFLANEKYFESGPLPPSRIALYENTGSSEAPEFTLISDNYLELDQYSLLSMYPSFLDLDGDGDKDMLIGDQGGKLHFFRNDAGPGQTFDFILDTPNYQDTFGDVIDIGQFATPQPFDLDNDGKTDLLIGEKNGNINYYRNVGTDIPSFELIEDTIGDVVATNFLGVNGFSVPYFFRDDQDFIHLFLGTETGVVNHYLVDEQNLEGSFTLLDEELGQIREGYRSALALGDLNNDGFPDLLYGQGGGGLAHYSGIDPGTAVGEESLLESITVYPNPARDNIRIENNRLEGLVEIRIIDITGRTAYTGQISDASQDISLQGLSEGLYVLWLTDGEKVYSAKLLIEK